jgi:outer membrane protein OmpA-like peptidoglycan-associated protein
VTTSTVEPLAFDPNIVAAQIDFVLVDQPLEFVDSSVVLRPSASIPLDLIASLLAGAPEARFAIEVHTDGRGAPAKNLTLSKRRAEIIRNALATRGVASSRLLIDGRGEAEPIANDATLQGQAANRRVLFVYQPTQPTPSA